MPTGIDYPRRNINGNISYFPSIVCRLPEIVCDKTG